MNLLFSSENVGRTRLSQSSCSVMRSFGALLRDDALRVKKMQPQVGLGRAMALLIFRLAQFASLERIRRTLFIRF
jgi:hypothetical protein